MIDVLIAAGLLALAIVAGYVFGHTLAYLIDRYFL